MIFAYHSYLLSAPLKSVQVERHNSTIFLVGLDFSLPLTVWPLSRVEHESGYSSVKLHHNVVSGVQILNCFKMQGYYEIYEMQFLPANVEKGENICFVR